MGPPFTIDREGDQVLIRVVRPVPGRTDGRLLHTVGEEADLTDALAVSLLNDGFVEAVGDVVEKASVEAPEKAVAPPGRRGRKAS